MNPVIDTNTEKPPPKEILAKRFGRLRSFRMKTAVKSPESAVYRRAAEHSSFQRFSSQHLPPAMRVSTSSDSPEFVIAHVAFSFTQIPLFPRNPIFPASGPAIGSFNDLHAKSKFLAINPLVVTHATNP